LRLGVTRALQEQIRITTNIVGQREHNRINPVLEHRAGAEPPIDVPATGRIPSAKRGPYSRRDRSETSVALHRRSSLKNTRSLLQFGPIEGPATPLTG
jgi:hypothetical protein